MYLKYFLNLLNKCRKAEDKKLFSNCLPGFLQVNKQNLHTQEIEHTGVRIKTQD